MKNNFAKLKARLVPNGMLWVAWPKKSSGFNTDLSFEVVQRAGLEAGLVDTKISAELRPLHDLERKISVEARAFLGPGHP